MPGVRLRPLKFNGLEDVFRRKLLLPRGALGSAAKTWRGLGGQGTDVAMGCAQMRETWWVNRWRGRRFSIMYSHSISFYIILYHSISFYHILSFYATIYIYVKATCACGMRTAPRDSMDRKPQHDIRLYNNNYIHPKDIPVWLSENTLWTMSPRLSNCHRRWSRVGCRLQISCVPCPILPRSSYLCSSLLVSAHPSQALNANIWEAPIFPFGTEKLKYLNLKHRGNLSLSVCHWNIPTGKYGPQRNPRCHQRWLPSLSCQVAVLNTQLFWINLKQWETYGKVIKLKSFAIWTPCNICLSSRPAIPKHWGAGLIDLMEALDVLWIHNVTSSRFGVSPRADLL